MLAIYVPDENSDVTSTSVDISESKGTYYVFLSFTIYLEHDGNQPISCDLSLTLLVGVISSRAY